MIGPKYWEQTSFNNTPNCEHPIFGYWAKGRGFPGRVQSQYFQRNIVINAFTAEKSCRKVCFQDEFHYYCIRNTCEVLYFSNNDSRILHENRCRMKNIFETTLYGEFIES